MPSKVLLILIGLTVISLGLPQEKILADAIMCQKMKEQKDIPSYISCLVANSPTRYGKRASPFQTAFYKHLLPSPFTGRNSQPSNDLQEYYEMLKYEDNEIRDKR